MSEVRQGIGFELTGLTGLLLLLLLLGGCADSGLSPPTERPPDPAAGLLAFQESCAGCHVARDAFDLAFFGFDSADIIRRALGHVDSTSARNIAAYVESLDIEPVGRDFRPFQPGGRALVSDEEMFVQLFGEDRWPSDLTVDELAATDVRTMRVPVRLPVWSSEADDLDWLPEKPLPQALLQRDGGALALALERYHQTGTEADLLAAMARFQALSRGSPDVDRVCAGEAVAHRHPLECFEARRWMSVLAAEHYLREGAVVTVPEPISDLWWDVGSAARSLSEENPDHFEQVRRWFALGWSFDPVRQSNNQGYFPNALRRAGRPRHAALVKLVAMVRAPEEDAGLWPYTQLVLVGFTQLPDGWAYPVAAWGLEALLTFQERGIRPDADRVETARRLLGEMIEVIDHVELTEAERERLRELRERVEAGLDLAGPTAGGRLGDVPRFTSSFSGLG